MYTDTSVDSLKSFIYDLATESSAIIQSYFRKQVDVSTKEDNTPVTIADRKAETFMRERIQKSFPEHGIIGEEFGTMNPDSEFTWVLDPIDGTKSFVCGAVTFGSLIGLLHNQKPTLGAIALPALNEFLIGDGNQALLNGNPVTMRGCKSLHEAVLLTTDPADLYRKRPKIFESVKFSRGLGDCYGYYLLATGFADVMIDPQMSAWDLLPLIPIIRGAGGIISGWDGNPAESAENAVAASPEIHTAIIKLLSSP